MPRGSTVSEDSDAPVADSVIRSPGPGREDRICISHYDTCTDGIPVVPGLHKGDPGVPGGSGVVLRSRRVLVSARPVDAGRYAVTVTMSDMPEP